MSATHGLFPEIRYKCCEYMLFQESRAGFESAGYSISCPELNLFKVKSRITINDKTLFM
jgi:hypothetical protein